MGLLVTMVVMSMVSYFANPKTVCEMQGGVWDPEHGCALPLRG